MSISKLASRPGLLSVDDLLDRAEKLGPMLRDRAADIEASRRLPPDVLEVLRSAGCFRVLHPVSHGGLGGDLLSALRLFEMLARSDASTAWTVMIGSASWIDLVGLPRESFDRLFTDERGMIVAGVFNPSGSIVRDADNYRVSGRWAFASGCEHATWIYVNCVETGTEGEPQFRIAVLAPDEVEIEDTWDVAGLRGTGSHHIRVDVTVPADRTLLPFTDPSCIDDPAASLPIPAVFAVCIASVALGIGRGALDDVVALAPSKTPLLSAGPLGTSPTFHEAIARADTELSAAQALLHRQAAGTWSAAEAGRPLDLTERGALRSAATWIVERAEATVDACHRAGGGGAIYVDSPLQRRLRDIQTLRQHFLVRPDTFAAAGTILAGGEPDLPIF